jgi:hypothetical protein
MGYPRSEKRASHLWTNRLPNQSRARAFLQVNNALQVEPTHAGIVHRELFSAQVLSTANNPPLRVLALGMSNIHCWLRPVGWADNPHFA